MAKRYGWRSPGGNPALPIFVPPQGAHHARHLKRRSTRRIKRQYLPLGIALVAVVCFALAVVIGRKILDDRELRAQRAVSGHQL